MKKRELIKNFLIGGCVGKTLMEVSGIIANFFMKNNLTEAILQLKSLMVIFIIGGIAYIFANLSITKIEKKDMKSKDRQNLLKKQTGFLLAQIGMFVKIICNMKFSNLKGVTEEQFGVDEEMPEDLKDIENKFEKLNP